MGTTPTEHLIKTGKPIPRSLEAHLRSGGVTVYWKKPIWLSRDRTPYLVHLSIDRNASAIREDWFEVLYEDVRAPNGTRLKFIKHVRGGGPSRQLYQDARGNSFEADMDSHPILSKNFGLSER